MAEPFLDTNILLRHLLQDGQSTRASAYLARIEQGEQRVHKTTTIVSYDRDFDKVHNLTRIEP